MVALELARFEIDPARLDEMLEARTAAIAALRRACPGFVRGYLARLDERTWLDALVWRSRADAETAAAQAPSIPEAAAYFGIFDSVLGLEHGDIFVTDEDSVSA